MQCSDSFDGAFHMHYFFDRHRNQILPLFGDFDVEMMMDEHVINVELVREHGRLTRQSTHSTSLYSWPQWFRHWYVCNVVSRKSLFHYPLRPGAQHNTLLPMLAWNSDVWSFTLHAYGDPLELAFYHLYTDNNPPATRWSQLRRIQWLCYVMGAILLACFGFSLFP